MSDAATMPACDCIEEYEPITWDGRCPNCMGFRRTRRGSVGGVPVFVDVGARQGRAGDIVYFDPVTEAMLVHPDDWEQFCDMVEVVPVEAES